MLLAMAEGGGWVNAGVMVGVVAAMMEEGEAATGKKERAKNYQNTVQFIILS